MESKARNVTFGLCFDSTLVIAAVSVVLPWSMCPIVPTFTCGLLRSNFYFAISFSAPQSNSFQIPMTPRLLFPPRLLDDFFGKTRGHLRIVREMHGEISAALCAAAQIRG